MSYSATTIIELLQFNYGVQSTELARLAGVKVTQIESAKNHNVITKKTHEAIASVYGDDWADIEKVRLYQKRYNIVMDLDYRRMIQLRIKKGLTRKRVVSLMRMNDKAYEKMENGERTFRNYPEYLKFVKFYNNDLVKASNRYKKDNKPVHYMTFKNIANRGGKLCWQTGTKIKI